MKQKKKGSCLGLFLKLFFLSVFLLSGLTAAGAAISVYFFEVDALLWTQVTAWNSYPLIAAYVILPLSFLGSFALTALISGVSALFGKGGKDKGEKSSRPRKRPQSNRKTTV